MSSNQSYFVILKFEITIEKIMDSFAMKACKMMRAY